MAVEAEGDPVRLDIDAVAVKIVVEGAVGDLRYMVGDPVVARARIIPDVHHGVKAIRELPVIFEYVDLDTGILHPMRLHLAYGVGAQRWEERLRCGEVVGLTDRLPYGYFWAQEHGCTVVYSEDTNETQPL